MSEIDAALIGRMRAAAARDRGPDGMDLFATPGPYTIGAGDVLQITVWDHPELAAAQGAQSQPQARAADAPAGFVVDQLGEISFPYAGHMKVADLRTDEVQALLTQRLSRVYRDPQVTVRIGSYRARKVYVDGEVRTPGMQPINDIPMTLYEAVTRAGGFTSAADQGRLVLVRGEATHWINLAQLQDSRKNAAQIMLRDGDLLRVASRDENGVYVMGEINRPMTAIPMKTGKLTLSDALSQAGSLNLASADASQMYVIRGAGADGSAQVYHLDSTSAVAMMLANQFELLPRDVVYVGSTDLARFSRVLMQLLPAINAGLAATVVAK
jgi:polysaccharide export outer membrane protein